MATVHNNHNVYVLGAGFSARRGLPTVSNFMVALRDAHEWLAAIGRHDESQSIEKVLEFRLKAASAAYRVRADLENIEELFSLAAAIDESLTRDICVSIAATLDYCAAAKETPKTMFTLEKGGPALSNCLVNRVVHPHYSPTASQYEALTYDFVLAGLLGRLGISAEGETNALISFNYDLLVEESLSRLGVPFSYAFPARTVTPDSSARELCMAEVGAVPLLKLHGSTNWAYPGRRAGKLTVFGSYAQVRQAILSPALVPPTWRKNFTGALTYVWQEALRQISHATRLTVIGFSIPPSDLHFKYLLAAGLRENISLREIVFVNTDPRAIKDRASELFGDLGRRPSIRIEESDACNFVSQGNLPSSIFSVGRRLHPSIQHVSHMLSS